MISLICPLLYFLLFNSLIVFISKKSFGKCLPLTFMINAFIYLITELIFHTFKVGFCINILLAIIPIIIFIWKHLKKESKDLKEWKDNYFTNGLIAFIVLFLGVFIFDLNRTFSRWDEWSHWGVMIKEMFRLDRLYAIDASTLMVHKDYPPIFQLFELFYSQLSGGYSEAFLIRSLHLVSFSLFIPAISENEKKTNVFNTIINSILVAVGAYLLILFFDQHQIINAIYIDYLMSIIIAYLMAIIVFRDDTTDNFHLVIFMMGFSFLLLLKQMGLPLYLMVLFMFLADIFIKNIKNIKEYCKKNKMLLIKIVIMLIIVPLAFWKGWSAYISSLNLRQQFSLSDINIVELKGIVSGSSGEEWQRETAKNYIQALKSRNITTSGIHLSYLQCFVLTMLLLYVVYFMSKKIYKKEKILLAAFTLSCGFIGYAFVMMVMYIFLFGSYEGPRLASYNRYMSTYVLIAMSLIYMLIINLETMQKENKNKISYLLIIVCCLFLIQKPEMLEKCTPKIRSDYPNSFEIHAELISNKTEENAKVFVISQNTLGEYQYSIKYYAGARLTNPKNYNWTISKDIDDYEKYFNENYKDKVLKFDYLYLAFIDDNFKKSYSFLFNEEINEQDIFKISLEDDKLVLTKI